MAEIHWTVRDKFSVGGKKATETLLTLFEGYEAALWIERETDTEFNHELAVALYAQVGVARNHLQDYMHNVGMYITTLEEAQS